MYIVLIFQLALAKFYTIKKDELKTLFTLPINSQDFELQTNNDEWNICQLQDHQLNLHYTQYNSSNTSNLAMLSLSQHFILILTADRRLNYYQDQIIFWSYEIPSNVDIQNASMRYSHVAYLVYFISNQVYRFNPYDKNFQEFEMFLNYQPQQIEICDQFIFVLNDGQITIYNNTNPIYQFSINNSNDIAYFTVINNNQNGYNIYILDKQVGFLKVEWNQLTHIIHQIDLIQNGVTMGIQNENNIYVAYKRQYKYIIAQYQIIDSQLQIVRKLQSKKNVQKIIAVKDYVLFVTNNKIDLLYYENKIYKIFKFGIKDIQMIGTKLIGISTFDIFQYQFVPGPNYMQCFYHLDQEIPYQLDYSLTFNEINKTIHKKKIQFSIELLTHKSNQFKITLEFIVCGIILILILLYSLLTLKQKNRLINEMETNLKQFKVKQVPLFKSLECAISPKGQHSKFQSFDQTSNFDLNKVRN